MANTTRSEDLASEHGLPGRLAISKRGTQLFIELDLPEYGDRIKEELIPGVEALVVGFLNRLVRRSRSIQQGRTVAATQDYIAAWVHSQDLDCFLTGLASLLDGATTAKGSSRSHPARRIEG